MDAMNQSLMVLQDTLVKQHRRLRDAIPGAPDAPARQALLTEMSEVTHRIQVVGALLFRGQTADLVAKVDAVRKATARVKQAIDRIEDLAAFVDGLGAFLALVDDAIDLAKKL